MMPSIQPTMTATHVSSGYGLAAGVGVFSVYSPRSFPRRLSHPWPGQSPGLAHRSGCRGPGVSPGGFSRRADCLLALFKEKPKAGRLPPAVQQLAPSRRRRPCYRRRDACRKRRYCTGAGVNGSTRSTQAERGFFQRPVSLSRLLRKNGRSGKTKSSTQRYRGTSFAVPM